MNSITQNIGDYLARKFISAIVSRGATCAANEKDCNDENPTHHYRLLCIDWTHSAIFAGACSTEDHQGVPRRMESEQD